MYRTGGWKKDPNPETAPAFEELKPRLQDTREGAFSSEIILDEYTPISDQGQANDCVANSTADALEILLGQEGRLVQVSRLFIYWMARHLDGNTHVDEGTYVRSAYTQLQKLGVCPEDMWPYSDSQGADSPLFKEPPLRCIEAGNSNKIEGAYRINSTGTKRLDDIDTALAAKHPISFGTLVGQELQSYRSGVLSVPKDQADLGGHALLIVGRRKSTTGRRDYWIRNSWSDKWGMQGHFWMSQEYMMWAQTTDLNVPTRIAPLVF